MKLKIDENGFENYELNELETQELEETGYCFDEENEYCFVKQDDGYCVFKAHHDWNSINLHN